jgi:hypothetical protein
VHYFSRLFLLTIPWSLVRLLLYLIRLGSESTTLMCVRKRILLHKRTAYQDKKKREKYTIKSALVSIAYIDYCRKRIYSFSLMSFDLD